MNGQGEWPDQDSCTINRTKNKERAGAPVKDNAHAQGSSAAYLKFLHRKRLIPIRNFK
jgi:hypothetical protein